MKMKVQMTICPFITYTLVNSMQMESESLIRYRTKVSRSSFFLPCLFLIDCNPDQICRKFMSSSLMKTRMKPQLLRMYRTKVSGPLFFYLCVILIHCNI